MTLSVTKVSAPAKRFLATLLPLVLLAAPLPLMAQSANSVADDLPLEEIQTFAEVFERIKRGYVEEVDDRTLLRNAMRGMLSELDPHSAYLDEEEYRSLRESTQGEFGGIGIEVGTESGQLMVITPIDDTPASRAGLLSRDVIVAIDGTPTDSLSLQEAVNLMRGEPGSQLRISVLRAGEESPREFTLTREVIRNESVKHEVLEPGYGYLRISQFQSRTPDQARRSLERMAREQPLEGLILDLRNNPGGVLQAAVGVADLFLDEGLIVYTEGRLSDTEMSFSASPETPADDVPLVVLINSGSASAAEIVAGALQDQRRGVIMGTESFGKGSVQQIMPLGNGEGLKLTTALYYTPNGRSIQAQGIEPDVEVVRGRLEVAEGQRQIREADLDGHLSGQDEMPRERTEMSQRLREDYQLSEALNLLKALNVVDRRRR
ncbi:S41 family peptidase [Vreelandella venusta]|uniref:Peptidase S41 n=1 Tax=Vreelandella venusta TaxID=44935 RepID=A0AAQ0CGI8_9GAMM|nr:S41 family peptidase [Halomonas venusta]MBR9924761.1 S41 family peptidase [Gammaproteobacteria bacterium]AZM94194.1 S41 family peptidase [Halomonas venusta]MDW0360885.1 S41 family peptidase [Halomonas venusta]MDX1354533.1 S41 family peptidase [Halomonas venusta]MDX1712601.1 S41 family peptidase [Halomonas venusta]